MQNILYMIKKKLIVSLAIFVLSAVSVSFSYAERPKDVKGEVASELQLEELDFNYKSYKQNLARVKEILADYSKGKKYDTYSEADHRSITDSLLQLEGFGLISHDAALRLKLEVAESRNESLEKIKKLEQELMDTRKEIEEFLSKIHGLNKGD